MQEVDETDAIRVFRAIPQKLRESFEAVPQERRGVRPAADRMSPHEIVHHIAEANTVAASMMIAAFGSSGSAYDWSWLFPTMDWVDRVGYASVPAEPSMKIVEGVTELIASLVEAQPELLDNVVELFDTPDGERYTKTVREIMRDEAEHAAMHIAEMEA